MSTPFEAPLAVLAGVLTIASPCVLPMLPLLLGTKVTEGGRARPLFVIAGFVLAFSSAGLLLALASGADVLQDSVRTIALAMLGATGVLRLWPALYDRLAAAAMALMPAAGGAVSQARPGNAGGFLLGLTLGAVWTPCAGPVLASILALVAQSRDLDRAAILLALYAAGAALPMLLIAHGGRAAAGRLRWLTAPLVQRGFGALVLATAIAMYFHYDVRVAAWLSGAPF
ncbi:cytochrome c biogenesis CcdA family protein [Massilia niastensis]|uniref:cytochrome c biogenesis CcdA family protein n=1 Tax=Massilia niastensis TaxID=544911 RepID=UPI00036AC4D8|nr:cytochrome c biogenesis protein CcdA [Massilia niastensis]